MSELKLSTKLFMFSKGIFVGSGNAKQSKKAVELGRIAATLEMENQSLQNEIDKFREALGVAYLDMTNKRHIKGDEFSTMQKLLGRK